MRVAAAASHCGSRHRIPLVASAAETNFADDAKGRVREGGKRQLFCRPALRSQRVVRIRDGVSVMFNYRGRFDCISVGRRFCVTETMHLTIRVFDNNLEKSKGMYGCLWNTF